MPELDAAKYKEMARTYLENPAEPRLRSLSLALYQKALQLDPDNIDTLLYLAGAYRQLGQPEEGLDCCAKALEINPGSFKAVLFRCMLQIPYLYDQPEQINVSRENYKGELERLVNSFDFSDDAQIAQAADVIRSIQPFFLPFQALDDTELQRSYGEFVSRILAAMYPEWAHAPDIQPPKDGERLRIGFASSKFRSHSVWKVIIKGWVSKLDQDRFELYGYSLGKKQDKETDYARTKFTHFVEGSLPFEEWCRRIYNDRLHVLIYPEIGMSRLAGKLAALRLAQVQCAALGHFVTTGLPTIDYFLSSDLIEPTNAQSHYTEKLVRLPNLSIYYKPLEVISQPLPRENYGLRPKALVYFCGQTMFKYLPQYDDIYPRIASQVGDCQFVFRKFHDSLPVTLQFEARLEKAFAGYGLKSKDHVVMLPWLPRKEYQRVQQLADIYLDSIGCSGVTTTLEALAYDLPVVTLPGAFIRSRMSSGILQRMGVLDTITDSLDEYVETAIRLGNDAEWRAEIVGKMRANKDKVYRDMQAVHGLESFLESVVHSE